MENMPSLAMQNLPNNEIKYPDDGYDYGWIATDKLNNIGVLITGGVAPIPSTILNQNEIAIGDIEIEILEMPAISKTIANKNIDFDLNSYEKLAEKGFFVYDWMGSDFYEIVVSPIYPIKVKDIPFQLEKLAKSTSFNFSFSGQEKIHPEHCKNINWIYNPSA